MKKIQKYPKTIGNLVDVKDPSIYWEKNYGDYTSERDDNNLDNVLGHLVERIDIVNQENVKVDATKVGEKQICLKGTDGNDYLIPCVAWQKPPKPVIDVYNSKTNAKTTSIDCVDTSDKLKVTISANGLTQNYTIYYTVDGTTPTTGSTRYNGAFYITPTMNEEDQKVTIKAIVYYTGLDSDVATVDSHLYRKLSVTFSYLPSDPGLDTDMYFSPSGATVANINQSAYVNPEVIKWENSQGTDTNSMIFFKDTQGSDIWFKASAVGWKPSDITSSKEDLTIRHLRHFGIYETSPNINNISGSEGKYEPYKNFYVTITGSTYDISGNEITPTITYKIEYDKTNTIGRTDVSNKQLSPLSETPTVSGNCTVSAVISAPAENIGGVNYEWETQNASKTISCRNLPTPTINVGYTADTHGGDTSNNEWAEGAVFTVNHIGLKDSDKTSVVGTGLFYATNGSTSINKNYSSPFTINGTNGTTTIAKNSVSAQRRVESWTDSDIAYAPTSNIIINRPHVYFGYWRAVDTGLTNKKTSTEIETYFNSLSNDDLITILTTDSISLLHVTDKSKLSDKTSAISLSYSVNTNAPIIAYPKAWGVLTKIDDGATTYTDSFSFREVTIGSVDYYTYYWKSLSMNGTLKFKFYFE